MLDKIKKLREATGAGVMEVKRALDEAEGDEKKAEKILSDRAVMVAEKKAERQTSQGLIDAYVHLGKIGVLVEVSCETDFVARNDEFKKFVHELALHVAASEADTVEKLLKENYFRDETMAVEKLLHNTIAKTGENIKIKRFVKFVLGE